MKLIETHLHTAPNSSCAIEQPREIARLYKNAGYDGIVVTNHIIKYIFDEWAEKGLDPVEEYLRSYRDLKKYGERLGLHVWLGAELNLERYNLNDLPGPVYEFLLYGLDEDFFRRHPRPYEYSQEELYSICKAEGIAMIQAHPYRTKYARVSDVSLLDGVEVLNANPRHESNNDDALALAMDNGLVMTAGGDFHMRGDEARAGMLVSDTVTDIKAFRDALLTGKAEIWRDKC